MADLLRACGVAEAALPGFACARRGERRLAAGPSDPVAIELDDGRRLSVVLGRWGRRDIAMGFTLLAEAPPSSSSRASAMLDPLTELPNRGFFHLRLRQALSEARASAREVTVLFVDLDQFKPINDSFGHGIGDGVLRIVADRLRHAVRREDVVARLDGDEFAVLQVGSDNPEGGASLAARLVDLLGRVTLVDGHLLTIGASVGVARGPVDASDPDHLMRCADLALYAAKAGGRGTFRHFQPAMEERMQVRRDLEFELRKAQLLGEFELHYQPQVDSRTKAVKAFEALLRWRHPIRGLVPPGHFIPLAEATGLILPIGAWALETACREAMSWPDHIAIAVNLSPAQFKAHQLPETVRRALASSGLPAARLELEITETLMLNDSAANLEILGELRALGVRIAMDDFGTGYSSLSYLMSFPFDKIKIDQCFVRHLSAKPDAAAVIRAVTGLGHSLGIETTVEGVETAEQLARVEAEGCTGIQGYLFSRPVPAGAIAELLTAMGSRASVSAPPRETVSFPAATMPTPVN